MMRESQSMAVLLNANAKRVTNRVLRKVTGLIPKDDIFVTHDAREAEKAARTVFSRGYPTVCTGGGDGTLVQFVTSASEYYGSRWNAPDIGVLKLGTGNALASYVGAGEVEEDLRRIRVTPDRAELPLLEVDGRLCHFAGLGLDAAIINDYNEVRHTWYARSMKYFGSVLSRSLPRQLTSRRRKPLVRVYNTGATAWRCDTDGDPMGDPIPPGALLYEGPITLIGASTTPYYGYGMQIYPFAGRMPGRVQFRIASSGVLEILAHLRGLWNGTHRSPTIQDFWVSSVALEFSAPAPLQVGGDAQGYRERVDFRLSERSVRLVDLRKSVLH
jgi:diacylglycerol kinase family enzyme